MYNIHLLVANSKFWNFKDFLRTKVSQKYTKKVVFILILYWRISPVPMKAVIMLNKVSFKDTSSSTITVITKAYNSKHNNKIS